MQRGGVVDVMSLRVEPTAAAAKASDITPKAAEKRNNARTRTEAAEAGNDARRAREVPVSSARRLTHGLRRSRKRIRLLSRWRCLVERETSPR